MTWDRTRPCPRCTFPLDVHPVQGLAVDRCARCHGTFVEHDEAQRLLGARLDDLRAAAASAQRSRLECPMGHGALVAYQVGRHAAQIEVDVCPSCAGLWLDQWEGAKLKRVLAEAPARAEPTLDQEDARTGAGWYLFQLFTSLPVEVWNPVRAQAVLVKLTIAACVAVFAAEVVVGQPVIDAFALRAADLFAGQKPWTLLTHAFLHGGLLHLLGNMWFLHVFGDNVEDTLGRGRYVQLFAASAVVAAAAQAASHPSSTIPLVGASGAIAGLMGAYLVLFPRVKVWVVWLFVRFKLGVVWYLGFWIAFQSLLAWLALRTTGYGTGGGTAFLAHVGGFLAGVAGGLVLRRRTR